jgi:hypothetical protein
LTPNVLRLFDKQTFADTPIDYHGAPFAAIHLLIEQSLN